jgi:heat shock protein HslJ
VRTLMAFTALSLLLACSDVGVHSSADLTLFRWPGNASKGKELAAAAQPSLSGTSWLAEDIGGRGVIDNAQTTITFEAEGRVAGSGGCNRYFGPVTIEGNAIRFGDLGATRMACVPALMDQEQTFFDALAATRSYRFDDLGHKLEFLGEDGAGLVRFSLLTP